MMIRPVESIRIGHRVELRGLEEKELNGKQGEVESLIREKGVWVVALDNLEGTTVPVPPTNLKLCKSQIQGDYFHKIKRQFLHPSIRHGVHAVASEGEAHCVVVKSIRQGQIHYSVRALKTIEAGTGFLKFWGISSPNGIDDSILFVKDEMPRNSDGTLKRFT